jgi:hypothetical protein
MTDPRPDIGLARRAARRIVAGDRKQQSTLNGIWQWINGVASGVGHFFTRTIPAYIRANLATVDQIVHALHDIADAYWRVVTWFDRLIWHTVAGWITRLRQQTQANLASAVRYLIRLIYVTTNTVLTTCLAKVRAERLARQREVARAEAQARLEIRHIHQVIEREAASAYRIDTGTRANLIIRLLDYAAVREPALRRIVGDIAGAIVDLLSVDDPILRIALGFLIRQVIDRLGIDRAVGALIHDLLEPILGQPKPAGLHDVVADISSRLIAMENQWAQFMEDGGSQIEQAGRDWRNITSLITSAAIVGFTAQAIANPDRWAAEISGTIGRAANDTATAAAKLFRG